MKKTIRILSVALVAVMLLSLSAAALADIPPVYIAPKGTKAGYPDMPEDFILLKTKSNDSVIKLYFSEQPDWATANWGNADGWASEVLDVDASGYAEVDREGHLSSPGKYIWNGPLAACDPETGELINPNQHASSNLGGGAYTAGKGNVTVGYMNNGVEIAYVTLTVEEDFYRTGIEGAVTEITWEPVFFDNNCFWSDVADVVEGLEAAERDLGNFWYVMYDKYADELAWYVSSVVTTYPAGNPITRVAATRRNDKTNSLVKYAIDYPASENVFYRISYDANDNVIGGEYFVDGAKKLYSGSQKPGQTKYRDSWFGDRSQGRPSKKAGLKSAYSFKSPRVK